jgi:hypothetical protein
MQSIFVFRHLPIPENLFERLAQRVQLKVRAAQVL